MLTEYKATVVDILNKHVQPVFILVFGSYAKGTAMESSDLDIAYFGEKDISDYERFLVAGELSSTLGIEVDLIDILKVDTVFAAQIFFTGELLYSGDDNLFFKERMKAGSMYVTLNEQREEVLRSIQERGNVYRRLTGSKIPISKMK